MSGERPWVISQCVRAAAAEDPELEALVDGDLRLTFAGLSRRVDAVAQAFIAAGLQPGERVGLWAPNSADWVLVSLGAMAAGGVLVPLNTRYKGGESHYVLNKARAAMLVVDDGFLGNGYVGMLRQAENTAGDDTAADRPVPSLPHLRSVISLGDVVDDAIVAYAEFLARGAAVDIAEVDQRVAAQKPDDVCDIVFTSGTTGRPKGAMTSHEANVRTSAAWADGVGVDRGDRYVIINPLFHSFGYRAGLMACVLLRATMYPLARFDVESTLQIISSERITVLPGPPTLFYSILDHPDRAKYDLSSLRLVVTGAATVPAELMHRIRAELGVAWVVSPYGLTEVAGTATICPVGTDLPTVTTSVGSAIPQTELAVVGSAGERLPAGENGEIVVRGYNVMLGYFEEPEATAEAIDADGWLHTGDVGYLDERGFLYLTGRLKDLFQTGGFNVYPVEIEQLLITHPDITEAAVIGVSDPRMGEVAHAFVVSRAGSTVEPDEVIAFARERIANFKVPRYVTVVEELPRNAMGKVQKFRLTQPVPDGQ
jgi:acyl-CoA synthetase (AMP-forming)/AMP-acid ligase II